MGLADHVWVIESSCRSDGEPRCSQRMFLMGRSGQPIIGFTPFKVDCLYLPTATSRKYLVIQTLPVPSRVHNFLLSEFLEIGWGYKVDK